jgi:hypothetical protein
VEWKADQAKKAGFLSKLGKFLQVVDIVSTTAQAAGYLWEGDAVGAGEVVVKDITKKGVAAAGAFVGTATAGPVGGFVGATAGDELAGVTTSPWIEKTADAIRNQQNRDKYLGTGRVGRYEGNISYVFHPPMPEGVNAPSMGIQYTGPVTATLEKGGDLKLHFQLKGKLTGGGIAGAAANLAMDLDISATADLTGQVTGDSFTAKGTSSGTGQFAIHVPTAAGGGTQRQSSSGSGAVTASGTITPGTLSGSLSSPQSPQMKPIPFVLTKVP